MSQLFFSPVECGNFSANMDFHKGSLVCEWLSKSVFSRDSQILTEKSWKWFMGHCKVHSWTRFICLLPDTGVGKTPPGSLDIWCGNPQPPQRHLCPWMDADFFVAGVGGKTEMRDIYGTIILISVPPPLQTNKQTLETKN